MARPRTISNEDILEEVRSAVLSEGPRFSIDAVAERLGVTAPALFKRFGSRNALMVGALKPSRPPFLDELEQGPDAERPFDVQLTELFRQIGAWFAKAMPAIMALNESGVSCDEVHAALEEAPPVTVVRTMARWLQRAQKMGVACVPEPETTAMAMLGALQNRAFLSRILRRATSSRDCAEDARRFCALFTNGIGPKSTKRRT